MLGADQRPAGLPRRVVVFGISSLPAQTLEALAVMGRFSQVLLAVLNPCQYHWGDLVCRLLLEKKKITYQYHLPAGSRYISGMRPALRSGLRLTCYGRDCCD